MSVLRLRVEAQRLKRFRLSDVPENIRLKHGERLVALAYKHAVEDGEHGYALLYSTLKAKRAMLAPSENVYRVSQAAWDAMIVESNKLVARQTRVKVAV